MITITQGDDDVVLTFTATDGSGAAVDITGAVFESYVRAADGSTITFDDDKHDAAADQVTNKGKFTLTLDSDDTESLPAGRGKEIVTKVVVGGQTIFYHGTSMLNVLSPLPER